MDDRATMEKMYWDCTSTVRISDQELALLPRDKSDYQRVEALKRLPGEEVRPLVRYLMIWLQDANWPISHSVGKLLLRLGATTLLEPIREVLATDDDIWKTNTINSLIHPQRADLVPPLREVLTRIAHFPSRLEIAEDTAEAAREALDEI